MGGFAVSVSDTFQELCHLRLEPGPHLVIAKGAIQLATTEEFQETFALRLEASTQA